jgi:hypothetical protein
MSRDGQFVLTISSTKARYAVGEPIDIRASFTYEGSSNTRISTAGSGPLGFGIVEPVQGLALSPGWRLSCLTQEIPPGYSTEKPFGKTGGVDGNDPDHDAKLAFLQDPILRLPVGTWHVYAVAHFSTVECGEDAPDLRAEIEIEVAAAEVASDGPSLPNPPQRATDRDGDFQLTLRSDKTMYRPDELIDVTGSLVYDGPEDRVEVAHDISGLILFGSREPVYGNINLLPGTRQMCMRSVLERNVPLDMPFRKGGGFPTDHPDVDLFRAFMLDPALRLPAGTWHLYAVSSGGCMAGPENPHFALEAEIAIEVSGEPVVIPPSSVPPVGPTPQIAPDESPGEIQPDGSVVDVVDDGTLELKIRAAESVYIEGEPVDVTARLTYLGADLATDYSGGITFSGTQIDGPRHFQWPPVELKCVRGGSISDFPLEAALAERLPRVRSLPPGNWRITAHFSGSVPSCTAGGMPHGVGAASVDIRVIPSSKSVESIPLLSGAEPTGAASGAECRLAHAGGDLALHPVSGLGLVQPDGSLQPIRWPFGFSAELLADGAILYDGGGRILAREGDPVGFPGGFGIDETFTVCAAYDFP